MPENIAGTHDIILENRQKATMTGITNVESYDDTCISADSNLGSVTICGSELKISRLSVETGDMTVEGNITSVVYSDSINKGNFWSRMFK